MDKCTWKSSASTPSHTWEATLESWEGSEFAESRGPRRSFTDCFRDVAEGCWTTKTLMTLSLVHLNTPTVRNQLMFKSSSFLAILNFRCIYIYFINCLLTFAIIIHKTPHWMTVNGGSIGINATGFSKWQKWKAEENTDVVCLAQFYRWSKTPLKRGVTFQTAKMTEQQQSKLWLHWIMLYSIWWQKNQ